MGENLGFQGKVAVVTGAGGGLGKAYALELAQRGAKVVVNDLGCSTKGEGHSKELVDAVVNEIKQAGGTAVPSYDSVEFGEKVIETAISNFGKVDIVINNAGILLDSSFLKMTPENWDKVLKAHLYGTFAVTRAAWAKMREQKFGRIVNTASGSGLFGNFGQANYSAAKLGIHGLTQTLAREGEKYNIKVNTIAPIAGSRMTSSMFAPEILEMLSPEKVVPLVMCLCHDNWSTNGGVFEVAGGWIAPLRWQRGPGVYLNGKFSAEDVMKNLSQVQNFEKDTDYPTSLTDTLQKVMKYVEESKPKL